MKSNRPALLGLRFLAMLVSMAGVSIADVSARPKLLALPSGAAIRQRFFAGGGNRGFSPWRLVTGGVPVALR